MNNPLAENSVTQLLNSVRLARDNAERADNRVDHSFYYALTRALEELQERRKAEMNSEPVAYTEKHEISNMYATGLYLRAWPADRERNAVEGYTIPLYRHAQPAPVVPLPDVVSVLLNHLEDVLPDDAFNLIDVKAWNAVSMLTCPDACRATMLQIGNSPVIPDGLPDGVNIYHGPKEKTILVLRQDAPETPDGYVMVPKTLTPKMITRLQLKSEIGGYVAANWVAAYSKFQEFWDIAIAAAPQEVPDEK